MYIEELKNNKYKKYEITRPSYIRWIMERKS